MALILILTFLIQKQHIYLLAICFLSILGLFKWTNSPTKVYAKSCGSCTQWNQQRIQQRIKVCWIWGGAWGI